MRNKPVQREDRGNKVGLALPEGYTGSSLFHRALIEAAARFPDVFEGVRVPPRAVDFKREYGAVLPRFELARVTSPKRTDVARFIADRTQAALGYVCDAKRVPMAEHMAQRAGAPRLVYRTQAGDPGLGALVPFEGRAYRGREVLGLVDRLLDEHNMTRAAARALHWIVEHIDAQGGCLDLRGHRFALLGAGAELAPTETLLRAGATVLWVDLSEPPGSAINTACGGGLVHAVGVDNLLTQPREVVAAIEAFADDGGPVHLGMFAYAAGQSQEWRLAAAMNAIVRHLRRGTARSVSLFISPTTVPTLQPEDSAEAQVRWQQQSSWKSALSRVGLLAHPGWMAQDEVRVGCCSVSIQGLSYQAAQYISKMAAAEALAAGDSALVGSAEPLTVSANVAGITRTQSLSHPLFEAAFAGAALFGVRIFDPDTTRALSGLLLLHDLLNKNAPGARGVATSQQAAALFSQQIHGGIFALPYVLEHAIRVAAVIGLGRNPTLWLRRRFARSRPAGTARLSKRERG